MAESFRWPLDEDVEALDLERGTITTVGRSGPATAIEHDQPVAAADSSQDDGQDQLSAEPDSVEEQHPLAALPLNEEHPLVERPFKGAAEHPLAGHPLNVDHHLGPPFDGAAVLANSKAVARRWALPVLGLVVAIESGFLIAGAFRKPDATTSDATSSVVAFKPTTTTSDTIQTPVPTPNNLTDPFGAAVAANRALLDAVGATPVPAAATPSAVTTPPAPTPPSARILPPATITPAPAATPAAPTGSVAITLPFQAEVYEDGRLIGLTGGKSLTLSAGSHQLELVNESLQFRATQRVNVFSNQTSRVSVSLPTGALHLNAAPWAEVIIDGRSIGETPLANVQVPIGPHRIVFRHPQFPEQTRNIIVTAQSSNRIGVDLAK